MINYTGDNTGILKAIKMVINKDHQLAHAVLDLFFTSSLFRGWFDSNLADGKRRA